MAFSPTNLGSQYMMKVRIHNGRQDSLKAQLSHGDPPSPHHSAVLSQNNPLVTSLTDTIAKDLRIVSTANKEAFT